MSVKDQEPMEHYTYTVTISLSKEALKYIKRFSGLRGIPEEFCKSVIINALKETSAEFALDNDIMVGFKVNTAEVTYPEPW